MIILEFDYILDKTLVLVLKAWIHPSFRLDREQQTLGGLAAI